MALERVSKILRMADEAKTSVIAFNCLDYNTIYPVIAVAEELNRPVVVMLYPEHCHLNNASNPEAFAGIVKSLARQVKVPIGLHLDHSSDYSYIIKAIQSGFTSVMIDGSMLSLDENIKITKKVTETAKILGADVEAELGHVGFANKSDQDKLDLYTKPEVAVAFCEETGIDSVAIAIGSAHGVYIETPKLDLKRLEDINTATDIPLVLHGGSGIPNDQLEQAFKKGINKFNVGTEYFQLYYDSMKEYCHKYGEKGNVFDMPKYVQEKLMAYLREKMQLAKF